MKSLRGSRALALVLSFLLIVPASAATRNSDQISNYDMSVTAQSGGQIAIEFWVRGTGRMVCLGADEIVIDENVSGTWIGAEYYDRDHSGMSDTDENYYGNTVYFDGVPGTRYRITVTIFAEDEERPDYNSETFYVTARD